MLKIGIRDSLQSKILNEERQLIVHLPEGYESSENEYPTLYLLDVSQANLENALVALRKLESERLVIEPILIAISNTNRDRDMMPLSAASYPVDIPGADRFLGFLDYELMPYIEKQYRCNEQNILRGSSLSGVFVLYAFLKQPQTFQYYIANSAGWYDDMDDFFSPLMNSMFQYKAIFHGKTLFIANSLNGPFDPNQEIHRSVLRLSEKSQVSFRHIFYIPLCDL